MEYVLGVDGGGTRTICLLADLEGNVLGQGEAGPSNFQAVGVETAVCAIRHAIEGAVAGAPSFSSAEAICLGLAGVDTVQDAALIHARIEALKLARQVCVVNDTEIALIGGVGGERGVAIVAGTGSAAFGCDGDGHKARSGGWGWILGDEGSAFDIGRQGLHAVVRALECRGEHTLLVASLTRRWGLTSKEDLIASLRKRTWSRSEVAGLAEWVTSTAWEGDAIALRITRQAGKELGLLANTVIRQLHVEGEFCIVLTGGVFQAGEIIIDPLKREVQSTAPEARLMPPIHPPVLGAIFMAWRKTGLSLDPSHMERAHATARAKEKS